MDAFNFAFSLFAIILGLSLVEVLSGFARALKLRHTILIGWLTPLLAIMVMLDISSFWSSTWQVRGHITPDYGWVLLGLIITGTYYLAASIIFPPGGESRQDYDEHYFAHHRQVLGAVFFCNAISFGWEWFVGHHSLRYHLIVGTFYAALAVGIVSRRRWVNLAVLGVLIALYLISGVNTAMEPSVQY